MRYLLAAIGLGLGFGAISGTATAEPVTIYEAMQQLRDREIQSVDGVSVLGDPLISGQIKGQGFRLRLTDCGDIDTGCKVTAFSACKTVATFTRLQSLEMANAYNNRDHPRGSMYVNNSSDAGAVLCVRNRRLLQEEDRFDMSDVFDWQLTLRDFVEFVEAEETSDIVRSIMGASR
jgi:hypothetical protein